MSIGIKISEQSLPAMMPLWQGANSNRRRDNVPTVAELLHCGKTTVFALVKDGKIQTVRLSKRKTLAVTASVLAYLNASIVSANSSEA